MCPDQESNKQRFILWDNAQPRLTSQSMHTHFSIQKLSGLGGESHGLWLVEMKKIKEHERKQKLRIIRYMNTCVLSLSHCL